MGACNVWSDYYIFAFSSLCLVFHPFENERGGTNKGFTYGDESGGPVWKCM